ncbi:MAG TPA: hypothetical protein VIX12_10335, partial [Candidatus Binataceae bacterium]
NRRNTFGQAIQGEIAMKPGIGGLAGFIVAVAMALVLSMSAAFAHDMGDMDTNSDSGGSGSNAMGGMGAHMKMSEHMTMTESRPVTPADLSRAQEILTTMREKLSKYQDYNAAIADGYVPYMPTVPQDVYHFSNRQFTASEYVGDFDLAHPGSLLYEKKTLGGYKLVGAMYDAPSADTPEQLDKLIPLSIAHWHAHTNICLPQGVTENDVLNGNIVTGRHSNMDRTVGMTNNVNNAARMRFGYLADTRFGFVGTISNEADCEAAGGNFNKQIFGWMVHAYPFASDDLKVAFSTDAP